MVRKPIGNRLLNEKRVEGKKLKEKRLLMNNGSCLCGAITFEFEGELHDTDACHCVQCRKWTGHYLSSTDVLRSALSIYGSEYLSWYQSSKKANRGFCKQCGSSLFFDPIDKNKNDWIGVSLGAFDTSTNTSIGLHIFVAEKGDYYEINDGVPQNEH